MRNTYGSYEQRITNIIYTNGYLDPMRYNGIYYNNNIDDSTFVLNILSKYFKTK